jgi:hypothetical protein
MQDVYSFVDTAQAFPEKIAILHDTIVKILSQTVECTIFIREYCGHGFGGMYAMVTSLVYCLYSYIVRATV